MNHILFCLLTLLFSLSGPAMGEHSDFWQSPLAAKTTQEMFYIENGVRRSLVSQNAGLTEIPATIFVPGRAPATTTLRLDQLLSPKTTVPLDSRYLNIKPPIISPIQVQPLGLPGQMPSVPLRNVILE